MSKTFTLVVDENQLRTIGGALQELPYRVSAPVLNALEAQVQAQQAPPAPLAPPASQELKEAALRAVAEVGPA